MLNEPKSRFRTASGVGRFCVFQNQWRSRLPWRETFCYSKWKNGVCQRPQCWPLWVERAQLWFQIIWFNLFFFWFKASVSDWPFCSSITHSRSKLENCSFGKLRRMYNADLDLFDCHCCGLKEPWHCLSVWLWLIFRVHWEEKWSWNPWWLALEVLVWLVRLTMVVICLIVAVDLWLFDAWIFYVIQRCRWSCS